MAWDTSKVAFFMMNFLKKKKYYIIFIFLYLLIIAPFIYNIFLYWNWNSGFLIESSVFNLNLNKYFSDLFYNKSHFVHGVYSIDLTNYFLFYLFLYVLEVFFSSITSYFILVCLFYFIGFYFFVKLFLELDKGDEKKFVIVALLGLLYFSSLSFFNYIKSTFVFLLPCLLLPALLYYPLKFLKTNKKKYLLPFLLLTCLMSDLQFTHFLINVLFINIFLLAFNFKLHIPLKGLFKKILLINVFILPVLFIFSTTLFIMVCLHPSDLSSASALGREDFYSMNATYINIFKQTTDWALFGGFQGMLYYEFSKFYSNQYTSIFAFLPYILLLYLFITNKLKNNKLIIISFSVIFLFLVQVMLGLHNPVYRYLYDNLFGFQVFRNITKFAPLLYLVLLILIYLLTLNYIKQKSKLFIVFLLLLLSLGYNIPYWSYAGWFFQYRTIKPVPEYWYQASDYINEDIDDSSKILVLPATYVLDVYNWNERDNYVQGSLSDVMHNKRSFRLSEILIGDLRFQLDANKLFIKDNNTVRQLGIDYSSLTNLAEKYNLDYVMVTKDAFSNYQDIPDIENWLKKANYKKEASFGAIDIYRNPTNFRLLFNSDNLYFSKIDNRKYKLYIENIKSSQNLSFLEPFYKEWHLYLKPNPTSSWCKKLKYYQDAQTIECEHAQKFFAGKDLIYLWEKPIFDDTHKLVYGYANDWTINPEYIKANYSPKYYHENSDGGIDIELVLYHKIQSYFYAGLFISGMTLLGCLGYLGYDWRKRKRKNNVADLE